MRLCTLYLCIREIRRYTDREYCATFTFCSSTVSVAIYATHKKTDRESGGEGESKGCTPVCASVLAAGSAFLQWKSFALCICIQFYWKALHIQWSPHAGGGGCGAWHGTRSLLVVVMLFKVSFCCILAMAIKSGKRVRFPSPPIRFSLWFRFLATLPRRI